MMKEKLILPKGWTEHIVTPEWRAFFDKHGLYNKLKNQER